MLNIISEVNVYLAKRTTLYAPIIQNVFKNTGSEEIICRTDPSTAVESRYLDGARRGGLNFSYYCKSKLQVTAREQLEKIITALDLERVEITEGLTISVSVVTIPVFFQLTDTGEYIFQSSFKLEYLNNRG